MPALIASLMTLFQVANATAPLLQRAKQDFEAGNYSAARTELKQALKLAPNESVLWSYLGMTEFKLHETAPAVADLEKARALDPHNALNDFNLGMMYHEQGDTAKALEAYRQGLALEPDDSEGNESYALLLMETRRYREAIEPLEKSRNQSPANLSLRLALIEAYIKAGLNDRGISEIQEFVKAPNCPVRDQLDLANLLVENKKADAARWVFEQVVQAQPDLAEAHAGLGSVLMDMGQYEAAATELGRAAKLSPGSEDYAMHYTEVLLLWRRYPAAVVFLNSVKSRFGNLRDYRYKLGLAYYGAGDYRAAADDLESVVKNYPDMDQTHYFLGHAYSADGNLKDAEVQYRKALSLNPADPSYYAALGHILSKQCQSQTKEAVKYLEKAMEMDPSDVRSKQDAAVCYEVEGSYPEAARVLEDVIQRQPELVSAHRMLARAYYRQGKKEQGDRESATAAKLEAEQPSASKR